MRSWRCSYRHQVITIETLIRYIRKDTSLVTSTSSSDTATISALRLGDTTAFADLVTELHAGLVRFARIYLPPSIAEDVVQDTWESVIDNIDRFEGRSSLKSWIYRILLNNIRSRARREARMIPFASAGYENGPAEPSVDHARLVHPDLGAGYWPSPPTRWDTLPEERLLSKELRSVVITAITTLPLAQREVCTLRDIDGWTAEEVCEALGISSVNQRVLLHRGRAFVRRAIEEYFDA